MVIRNLSRREVLLMVLFITFVLLLIFYKYVLGIQLKEYNQIREETANATAQLNLMESELALKEDYLSRLGEVRDRGVALDRQFNNAAWNRAPLVEIGMIALKNEVYITGFRPMETTTPGDARQEAAALKVKGNYKKFIQFLKEFQENALSHGAGIREIKINKAGQSVRPGGGEGDGIVEAELLLVLFTTRSGGECAPPEEIGSWRVGRENPFEEAEYISPHKGVRIMGEDDRHPEQGLNNLEKTEGSGRQPEDLIEIFTKAE